MILVTVGTQLPFDRMMMWLDNWAEQNPDVEFYCQIGPGHYKPKHAKYARYLPPQQLNDLVLASEVIVSHAGMGSILTALKYQRPIIIVPRLHSEGEHRNDHQVATAKWLQDRPGITVASDEATLHQLLDNRHQMQGSKGISEFASDALIGKLRAAILA